MPKKNRIFGIDFDQLSMPEAVNQILNWAKSEDGICRYVVTPNVDHVVKFQEIPALRDAYSEASMVVVDGTPVLWASRALGRALPGLVPGSDLCPSIFEAADHSARLRVFLFGAAEGVPCRAARNIRRRWPWIDVCGTYSPPLGFSIISPENDSIIQRINCSQADLLVIGLGAPKQEIWIREASRRLDVRVALCLGATIDFLAGEKKRAPVWMRQAGLEWFYRMMKEPRRLTSRYFHDAKVFPGLVLREMLKTNSDSS
jgi:N-acetylglucosaminyldiphosphoundecaprenol N-acetyl-beta-D-mannosaminyltransferase